MHEAHQVLVGVTEAHPASYAALEKRGAARHVESNHALVLVPDIHHPVQARLLRTDVEYGEQVIPIAPKLRESRINLLRSIEAGHECMRRTLVDERAHRRMAGGDGSGRRRLIEFLLVRELDISKLEDEIAALARSERQLDEMRSDGAPAECDAVRGLTRSHALRRLETVVEADEALPVRIKTRNWGVDGIEGVMVAPFLVLCLVVNGRPFDLDLPGREIALEILHVRGGIP